MLSIAPALPRLVILLAFAGLFIILLLFRPYPRQPASLHAQSGTATVFIPLDHIQQIAAGEVHTCAVTTKGSVKCWGANYFGELGDGSNSDRLTPGDVVGLDNGVSQVASRFLHTCALSVSGGVHCWGNNADGQLGDDTTTNRWTPVAVAGLSGQVAEIAVGGYHSCALTSNGGVQCWGYNGDGQLGDTTFTSSRTPVNVAGLSSGVIALAAGFRHTCALLNSGAVKCWGANSDGQLGDGTALDSASPQDVTVLSANASTLSAGYYHTCVVTTIGDVKCWGANSDGQLGGAQAILSVASLPAMGVDASAEMRSLPNHSVLSATQQLERVTGLNIQARSLALGGYHTCIVNDQSGVQCWGGNWAAQLGNGTNEEQTTLVDVIGLDSGVQDVTAGRYHTCALLTTGLVQCWGMNAAGQLGDSSVPDDRIPIDVIGQSSGVGILTTGNFHTCTLKADNTVYCWGWNGKGQLGDGTTINRQVPVSVTGINSELSTIAAGGAHSCAITRAGGLKCWGNNEDAQLGDRTTINRMTPVDVIGLSSGVSAVALGGFHTCVLLSSGGVQCWGYNGYGQLGDNSTTNRLAPVGVTGLSSGVKALTAGTYHTCALLTIGKVECWGSNGYGQLGDNTTFDRQKPVVINGLPGEISALSAGDYHTCALTKNGGVYCWGDNEAGQLGDDTTTNRTKPAPVVGLANGVGLLAAGGYHNCVLMTSGGVKCWGRSGSGQLGDGTNTDHHTPVDIIGLNSNVNSLALGDDHSCTLLTSGGVQCWGWNGAGQLGNGNGWRGTPLTVMVATEATATPTATHTPSTTPTATPTLKATSTTTPTPTNPDEASATATSTPTATRTSPGGDTNRPIYLAQVIRANTPTPTVTPDQPIWQRVGQAGLEVAALAVQGERLLAGDRREFNQGGGLYSRTVSACASTPNFAHNNGIKASVLAVTLQEAPGSAGALAAFVQDHGLFYTGDSGQNWLQTVSAIAYPRTVALAGGNVFYAGTEANGIYRSDDSGHTWVNQTTQPAAINVVILNASTLWIGTDDTGVWILTVGSNAPVTRNTGLTTESSKHIWDFAFQSANQIYLATYDGVYTGDGVNPWQPFGLQGKELLSLTIKDGQLYAGIRDKDNQGHEAGVWRRSLNSGDWQAMTSPGWDQTYTVRDLLYADSCHGLLAATDDGVWLYPFK